MQIGNITIQEQVLLLGTSIASALLVIYLVEKLFKSSTKATDIAFETVVMFILIWKASLFILSPQLVIQSPLSLLYFTGGYSGLIIAIFITLFYFYWKISKIKFQQNSLFLIYIGVASGFLLYELQLLLMEKGSIFLVFILVGMLTLMMRWKAYTWQFLDVIIWGSVLLLIISRIHQSDLLISLSKQEWLFLSIAGYTAVIQFSVYKRRIV